MACVPESTKYRNAPLELVILQVTHPAAPSLSRGEEAGLKAALLKVLPLSERGVINSVEFAVSGTQSSGSQVRSEPVVRFTTRDKRLGVTFNPNSITIETTKYDTWGDLLQLAHTVLSARMDIAPVDGVERIGLRYIDEVRVPDQTPDWSTWVNSKLAPPILDESGQNLRVQQQQATIQYATDVPNVLVTLRYGAVVAATSVGATVLARPDAHPVGPFFLIDSDAGWTPGPGEEIPALDPSEVLGKADVMHRFVKQLFEASLTDRLRTEVLDAE